MDNFPILFFYASKVSQVIKYLLILQVIFFINCFIEPPYTEWYQVYSIKSFLDSTDIENALLSVTSYGGDRQYRANTDFNNRLTDSNGICIDWTCSWEVVNENDFKNLKYDLIVEYDDSIKINTTIYGPELFISHDSVYFPILYIDEN